MSKRLEDLFPAPKDDSFSEESMARLHLWHQETIGNVEYHVCKICEKVEMSVIYEVSRDYSNWDHTTRFILRKANTGFPCSQT